MIVLPPISLLFSDILSSSVPDPDTGEPAIWNPATAYLSGNLVRRDQTKKIYESLALTSTVNSVAPEVVVTDSSPVKLWKEVGFLNRYKMFDYTTNQATSATNTLTVTFQKADRLDTIALSGMVNVANIKIEQIKDSTTYVLYDVANSFVQDSTTQYYSTRVFSGIPPLYLPEVRITLTAPGGTGALSVKYLMAGLIEQLGRLQNNVQVDATNYSKVDRDSFGNSNLVRRRSVPKITGTVLLEPSQVNRATLLRNSLNAKPALWTGVDNIDDIYYNSLVVVGFYKTFSFMLDNPVAVEAEIEIEEL